MRNFLFKTVVAFVLALFLSWAYLFTPQAFFSLDNRLRDFLFVIRGELPKSDNVVIIDIDEKSLKEHGQWPWQRDVISDMLYKLTEGGAGIIGLDIVFAENDRTSPHRFASKFPEISQKLDNYDVMLAKCLTQTPVVGGYVFTFEENGQENFPTVPAVFIQRGMKNNTSILKPKGIVLNIDVIQDSLYSSGFFNNTPDAGGMIRNVPLVMRYEGMIFPSLALEMVRIYSGVKKVNVIGDNAGIHSIKFGEFNIPTDHSGRLVVNFRGPGKHYKYISAADIISGNFNKKDVDGKFILVGTSAVGLFDLRSIPFDSTIAGVEVHANAIDNILTGDFLQKPADIIIYDLIIIWALIFSLLIIFSLIKILGSYACSSTYFIFDV